MGLSKSISAPISRACGDSPGPGGFLRKSPTSLPAQNASPAPCQSTTRISSSSRASVKISVRLVYMPAVMAFFFSGRFNSTRRMPLERSVMMSFIVRFLVREPFRSPQCSRLSGPLGRAFLRFRHSAACAQPVDVLRVKSQLPEDLFGVLDETGRAPCRHLGDAVHLNRATDRRGQLASGAFERNHDVVCLQLWIVDHLLRPAYGAE